MNISREGFLDPFKMSKTLKTSLPFFLLFTILTIVVKDNGFFWDTLLQASKYAHFYYENNFQKLLVSADLDAGHPPLFGIYLGGVWKIFGRSLFVSHFAMLPFLLGIVWQVYRLIDYFAVEHKFLVMLLVLTNTILLGHSTLVSPDVVFLFCFLLSLNGVLYFKKWQIILGTIGLGWLSIRGIFAIAALMGIHIQIDKKLKPLSVFIPVILTTAGYYIFHYFETGWLLSTPHEGWSHHRSFVGVKGLIRNMGVLGWRLIDFGNIALWIAFIALFFRSGFVLRDKRMRTLYVIPLMILLCYTPALILFQNPIGHRYLLPFYICFAVLVGIWFTHSQYNKKWLFGLLLFIQLSGNFWVYPKQIAKGWDCTMAHLPYYGLMDEMKTYIADQNIEKSTVGTEFPNIGSRKYIDLNDDLNGFPVKNMTEQSYILYSNIFNDFSDEALIDLEENWIVEKELKRGQVCVILYKKASEN